MPCGRPGYFRCAALGDNHAALQTQNQFLQNLERSVESADGVPIASQVKSAIQAGRGDLASAEETQQRFIRQCPVISQATSAVQAALGDNEAALRTQQDFLRALPNTAGHSLLVLGGVAQSGRALELGFTLLQLKSMLQADMNSSMNNPASESIVIRTGDVIMLKSHAGTYISARDGRVCSQFENPQRFHVFMI